MSVATAPPAPPPAATSKKAAAAKPKQPKTALKHPAFAVMIAEAIASLKEHSGSSVPAIKKAVAAKHAKDLPANWEKVLSMSLKRLTASGKLLKVKASYKLGEALKKEPKKKAAAPKKKAAAGVKKAAAKPKKPKAAAGPKKPKSAAPKKPAGVKKPKSAAPKKKVATAPKK